MGQNGDDRESDIEMTGKSDAASGAEQSKPLIGDNSSSQTPPEQKPTPFAVAMDFAMCFGCLQTSYLIWGKY